METKKDWRMGKKTRLRLSAPRKKRKGPNIYYKRNVSAAPATSASRRRLQLKNSSEELNTSCLGENAVMPLYLSAHGDIYYPREAQCRPTTSTEQETYIYIPPNCATHTDWQAETNTLVEEPHGTDETQENPLAPKVSGAEQSSQEIQSTGKPRAKKPKEKDNLLIKRTSKRLHTEPTSNPKKSNDVSEDFSNDFNVFGRFVATQLKNLNDDDAVLAQSEMQEVLIRYRLNKIKTRYEVPIEHLPSGNESVQPGSETEVTTADEVLIMKCEPDSE